MSQFLKLLADDSKDDSEEVKEHELALSKAVDNMVTSLRESVDYRSKKEKHREYVDECREKLLSTPRSNYEIERKDLHDSIGEYVDECQEQISSDSLSATDMESKSLLDPVDRKAKKDSIRVAPIGTGSKFNETPFEVVSMLSYQKKVSLLHELLSACLAVTVDADSKSTQRRRSGYDARHRVALRLLTAWLNINWITMVCSHLVNNISCFLHSIDLIQGPLYMLLPITLITMHNCLRIITLTLLHLKRCKSLV